MITVWIVLGIVFALGAFWCVFSGVRTILSMERTIGHIEGIVSDLEKIERILKGK